jgi:hypothetical protein
LFRKNVLLTACLFASASSFGTAAARHPHPMKVQVHFLATSTSVHSGLGTSQDAYLVEVTARGMEEPIFARLVDEFPPYQLMLPAEALESPEGVTLKVTRDQTCDRSFGLMPLRAAPGDPMAILPERLGFQPVLPRAIRSEEVLPCYRIVR